MQNLLRGYGGAALDLEPQLSRFMAPEGAVGTGTGTVVNAGRTGVTWPPRGTPASRAGAHGVAPRPERTFPPSCSEPESGGRAPCMGDESEVVGLVPSARQVGHRSPVHAE